MICRERRNLPHEIVLENDMSFVWDHRIAVSVGSVPDGQWQLKPGGTQPWSDEARQGAVYRCWRKLPASVRDSMPVVSGPLGVFSAPLLAFNSLDQRNSRIATFRVCRWYFAPADHSPSRGFLLRTRFDGLSL